MVALTMCSNFARQLLRVACVRRDGQNLIRNVRKKKKKKEKEEDMTRISGEFLARKKFLAWRTLISRPVFVR